MEASAVPQVVPAGVGGMFRSPRLLRVHSDARLVVLVRERHHGAFEVIYDRHHKAILSFCRHMLSDAQEAEDAVQHTFLAAYNDLISSEKPIHLRAWLFTIARNRCYSVLRARREQPTGDLGEPATEGLASQVQRRQDLRDLVVDMRHLPDDQRAALVLAELDALSHDDIGQALGVPREKVKALVFQARESLIASRAARETDCSEIREQLATQRGGALRRSNLRRHLRECPGCREFRKQVERQRRQLAVLLPVAPTLALKEAVLAAIAGGGAAAGGMGGGGIVASLALKSGLVKGALGALVAGVGTAGTLAATQAVPLIPGSAHQGAQAAHVAAKAPTDGNSSGPAAVASVASGAPAPIVVGLQIVNQAVMPAASGQMIRTTPNSSAESIRRGIRAGNPFLPLVQGLSVLVGPVTPAAPVPLAAPPVVAVTLPTAAQLSPPVLDTPAPQPVVVLTPPSGPAPPAAVNQGQAYGPGDHGQGNGRSGAGSAPGSGPPATSGANANGGAGSASHHTGQDSGSSGAGPHSAGSGSESGTSASPGGSSRGQTGTGGASGRGSAGAGGASGSGSGSGSSGAGTSGSNSGPSSGSGAGAGSGSGSGSGTPAGAAAGTSSGSGSASGTPGNSTTVPAAGSGSGSDSGSASTGGSSRGQASATDAATGSGSAGSAW